MSERAWYRSQYWRIALGFLLLLATLLVVQGSLFLWIAVRTEGGMPARSLLDFATIIALDVGRALDRNERLDLATYMERRFGTMHRVVYFVGDDGRVYASQPGEMPTLAVSEAERRYRRHEGAGVEPSGFRLGRRLAFAPVFQGGRQVGTIVVEPPRPSGSSTVVREIGPIMLAVAVVLVSGGTVLAALLIFGPAHRRLRGLEDAARRLGGGELTARAPEHGGDEIAAVAHAFNQMAADLAGRAAQLQAADRARRQLLADVSHELTTPLTAIRGYVETLTMPGIELDEATRARYLGIIDQERGRLERIVGELLDLARLEAGGGTLRVEEVQTADLFARVVARHERESREKEVLLASSVAEGAETLQADPHRLEQALQNLAANALRHTLPGGRIELSARRLDGEIAIAVRDTGEGIAPEHLALIFDRFYKVDASRAGSHAGSGLGLSIVKAIVERHGGTISARSRPGVETVFEIRLPMARR